MLPTKGYAAATVKAPLTPFTFERRDPLEHDVVIDIKYCGICHSDIHQARNEWGGSTFPMVPGHEIAGIVTNVGSKVKKFKVGDHVGVGCMVDSCRTCAHCERGLEQYCDTGMTATYNSNDPHTKKTTYGGYSDKIVVDENYVLHIPKNLPLDEAAPLMCAGITMYSPLKRWNAGPGKQVAILGLGGLGHMGVKLAKALGAEVTVISQSDRKRDDAIRLGADHFYAASNPETFEKLKDHFDLIINTVSVDIDWNEYLHLVKVDGTMVIIGVPEEPNVVKAHALIRGRKSLAGSLIGGIKETQEMLDFCGEHNITCDIEIIPIQQVNNAYARVVKSDVRYRFVIDMATL